MVVISPALQFSGTNPCGFNQLKQPHRIRLSKPTQAIDQVA
jgi:hypothetical protein